MKKFVYKFLAVVVSFVTAIAMIPLSNGSVAYAETAQVTSNVKYFSTTMYNFDKTTFNQATDTAIGIDKITGRNSESKKKQARQNGFYFINDNNEKWAAGQVNQCNPGDGNNNVLVQGIVKNTLDSKGNIQFNYKNAGVFASPETNINGRDVYQNVQFPFVYDSTTGYYEFNSDTNHVHSGKLDGETLNLYSGSQTINKQGTFFPFNNDNDSSADYHFGMNMSVPFYMNEDGKDQNNNNMKFEFSGDDDVWVFINGKLVLDIGGIHAAIGGSIDFATGEVKYTFGNGGTVYAMQGKDEQKQEIQNKTYNLYRSFGITRAELASGENNLQIFYLERGAGKSNCKIKFNLQQKDTLQVSKTLGADTPYTENSFEFQLLKRISEGKYEAVPNKNYALYNGSSLISNNTTTDKNGKFYLQAGQHANFSAIGKDGSEYKVVELTTGYTTTWTGMRENVTNGSAVTGENAYIVPIQKSDKDDKREVTTYTVNCENTAGVVLNDDTIVLDYGKPVEYNVTANDTNAPSGSSVYGIGKGNLPKNSSDATGYTGLNTDVALDNGNIKINENGVVTYTPTRYMNSVDKANYAVQYQVTSDNANNIATTTKYAYASVNVLPATSVYYEDDFGSNDNTDANVAIVWTGTWNQEGTSQNETQSDKNSQYGWDDSYKDDTGYSNGSAHVSSQNFATATFRFTGTGVDVYSRTNEGVGKISTSLKKVTKNADGTETVKAIKYKSIDNLSISGDYYQIPTLNYDDLNYGTYEVTIKVITVSAENRGTYYLDGIRVYNPLGKVDANSTAGKAYEEANESNAQYIQVRKYLLDSSTTESIDKQINGVVFIDKSKNTVSDSTSSVGTYREYGPKNEVYLKSYKSDTNEEKIQSVAFTIDGYKASKNKVFIGLKSPTGQSITARVTNGNSYKDITLSSASDLYYEITPDSNGNVVIQNMSYDLLSITKVRITTKNSINGLTADYSLTSTPELMSYVNSFDTLQEEQDTIQKDTEDTLDKGDVDIDNPSDNNTNTDNDKQDNSNQQTQSNNIWNKIMSSIKGWFRR